MRTPVRLPALFSMRSWTAAASAAALLAAIGAGSVSAAEPDGKALYTKNCAMCHGDEGKADSPMAKKMGVHPLDVSDVAGAEGVAFVVKHIREDPKHKMVSKKLSDEELQAPAGADREAAGQSAAC
jgi:mono/diheme cytochrome c family protein